MVREIDLIDILKKYRSVRIYGAGTVAGVAIRYLNARHYDIQISSVIVTAYENNPYHIQGIPLISLDELEFDKEREIILIATMEKTQAEIIALLDRHKIKNIVCMWDLLYESWNRELLYLKEDDRIKRYVRPYLDTYMSICHEFNIPDIKARKGIREEISRINSDKLNIARLVVVLGTKCSLRCRDCNNLMPYFRPQTDLDEQGIISALKNITDKTQSILKCELIGGEPFMAQNITNILKYVIDNPVIKYIEITTNGTIIPNKDLALLMQNSKVIVRISDYGSLVNKEKIIHFLEVYNIRYIVLELGNWVAPGTCSNRNRTEKELKEYYSRCSSGYYCKTLYDGKIFSCARAASLYALGFMKENEYVDVKEELDVQSMKEFLLQDYSAACNYCDISIDNKNFVPPAIQL